MPQIHIMKAKSFALSGTEEEVPSLLICVDIPVPKYDYSDAEAINKYASAYQKDAETLARALYKVLPGGTFDRFLGELLSIKASYYLVSYERGVD